ncbi:acetamidase/formamidase family protein [Roseicella sp. DB1501]|uniref:acetamidase/formamidase family protein n=1 Tax=Roseicella sp. DB1501 TaxID=2730925 RepID=UPI001C2B7CFF|nr:acetamidase/formamidase family protein [Roseicella sp. DB1501]
MCQGDDPNCRDFEKHRLDFRTGLAKERRSFLKSGFAASGGAAALATAGISLVPPALAQASAARGGAGPRLHSLPANAETVHWGYFSKSLAPRLEVSSGDYVTIETLTHHANDDAERMVQGDPGAESVFLWTKDKKGVMRRGAGPGDGGGLGVHICTGPVAVRGAEPGDVLEVRILDVAPRPSANPAFRGLAFGSNAAANWGFHYKDLLTGEKPREVVTIYELDATGSRN